MRSLKTHYKQLKIIFFKKEMLEKVEKPKQVARIQRLETISTDDFIK